MDKNFLQSGCFLASIKDNTVWWQSEFCQNESAKKNEISFYCNDFFLEQPKPWLVSDSCNQCSLDEFKTALNQFEKKKPKFEFGEIEFDDYQRQYEDLRLKIKQGNIFKGVPYAIQNGKGFVSQENISYFLDFLFNQDPNDQLYLYGFWDRNLEKMVIGMTPELIFQHDQSNINTAAIAGTFKNQCDEMEKIIAEHELVIDDIVNELGQQGTLHKGETKKINMGRFSHLRTDVWVSVPGHKKISFENILNTLHPTAALGAFPRKAGKKWLKSIKKKSKPRGYYAGVFGVSNQSTFGLCVGMIRCLQWDCGQLRLIAGGGVIAQSDLEKERQEIVMKIQSIKDNLGF